VFYLIRDSRTNKFVGGPAPAMHKWVPHIKDANPWRTEQGARNNIEYFKVHFPDSQPEIVTADLVVTGVCNNEA